MNHKVTMKHHTMVWFKPNDVNHPVMATQTSHLCFRKSLVGKSNFEGQETNWKASGRSGPEKTIKTDQSYVILNIVPYVILNISMPSCNALPSFCVFKTKRILGHVETDI